MRKLSRDDMLSKVKSRPWRRPWACLVFLFSSFLIFSSCATITPFGSEGVDGTMTLTKQEEVLWDDSRREQRQIAYSKMLYRDEALDTYLNRVARTVLPLEASGELLEVSVNVILSPYLNAFAYPNGAVYIHSGMLARIENEAQLAALIGHELTHATHRHLLRSTRTSAITEIVAVGIEIVAESYAGGEYGALGNLVSGVGRKAITSGYSRDYEREADVVGLRLLVEAGYDPHEAPKLFMHLKEHLEEENIDEPFFFGSHPKVKERIDSYNEQIAAHYPETTGKVGKEDYEKHLYGILMANIPLEMKKGRYEVVLRSAKRCLELRPDAAVPYRYIGIINMKFDYDKEALDAFNTYLLRNPNAKDKQEIKDYIKKVKAR